MSNLKKIYELLEKKSATAWNSHSISKVCGFLQASCVSKGVHLLDAYCILLAFSLRATDDMKAQLKDCIASVVQHPSFDRSELFLLGEVLVQLLKESLKSPFAQRMGVLLPIRAIPSEATRQLVSIDSSDELYRFLSMFCDVLADLSVSSKEVLSYSSEFLCAIWPKMCNVSEASTCCVALFSAIVAGTSSSDSGWPARMEVYLSCIIRWLRRIIEDLSSNIDPTDVTGACTVSQTILRVERALVDLQTQTCRLRLCDFMHFKTDLTALIDGALVHLGSGVANDIAKAVIECYVGICCYLSVMTERIFLPPTAFTKCNVSIRSTLAIVDVVWKWRQTGGKSQMKELVRAMAQLSKQHIQFGSSQSHISYAELRGVTDGASNSLHDCVQSDVPFLVALSDRVLRASTTQLVDISSCELYCVLSLLLWCRENEDIHSVSSQGGISSALDHLERWQLQFLSAGDHVRQFLFLQYVHRKHPLVESIISDQTASRETIDVMRTILGETVLLAAEELVGGLGRVAPHSSRGYASTTLLDLWADCAVHIGLTSSQSLVELESHNALAECVFLKALCHIRDAILLLSKSDLTAQVRVAGWQRIERVAVNIVLDVARLFANQGSVTDLFAEITNIADFAVGRPFDRRVCERSTAQCPPCSCPANSEALTASITSLVLAVTQQLLTHFMPHLRRVAQVDGLYALFGRTWLPSVMRAFDSLLYACSEVDMGGSCAMEISDIVVWFVESSLTLKLSDHRLKSFSDAMSAWLATAFSCWMRKCVSFCLTGEDCLDAIDKEVQAQKILGHCHNSPLLAAVLARSLSMVAREHADYFPIISVWAVDSMVHCWISYAEKNLDREGPQFPLILRDELHFLGSGDFSCVLGAIPEQVMTRLVIPLVVNADMSIVHVVMEKLLKARSTSGQFTTQMPWLAKSSMSDLFFAVLVQHVQRAGGEFGSIGERLHVLEARVGLRVPKKNLLEELPLFVYYLLMLAVASRESAVDLVQHSLLSKLNLLQAAMKTDGLLVVQHWQTQHSDNSAFSRAAFNHLLMAIIWTLGSASDRVCEQASQALQVACTLQARGWNSSGVTEEDCLEATKRIIASQFLFVMSHLLQQDWNQQTEVQQCQCMRALRALVQLMAPVDVAKFLPKIVTAVDSALCLRSRPGVQGIAVRIVIALAAALRSEIPIDHHAALIVSMFSIVQGTGVRSESPSKDIASPSRAANLNPALFEATLPTWVLRDLRPDVGSDTRSLAIQYLVDVLSNQPDLVQTLLPSVPATPELHEIHEAHHHFVSGLSLEKQVERLIMILKHSSNQMVLAGLRECARLLRSNQQFITETIKLDISSAASKATSANWARVLMKELLNLSARQHESDILEQCAVCMGELGAINPSLFNSSRMPSTPSSGSTPGKNSCHPFLPLDINFVEFGLHLLAVYVVPGLKSAQGSSSQDKWAFAIQKLLHLLADYMDKQQQQQNGTENTEMPPDLRRRLVSSGIFEIVEPFWLSKYSIKELPTVDVDATLFPSGALMSTLSTTPSGLTAQPLTALMTTTSTTTPATAMATATGHPLPPPGPGGGGGGGIGGATKVFTPNLSFTRWIGDWCRQLILLSAGPLRTIYYACRGVVRNHSELCQFLIPYLLLDCLSSQPEYTKICVEELNSVLHYHGGDDKATASQMVSNADQRAVQFVFTILDIFTMWQQQCCSLSSQQRSNKRAISSSSLSALSKSSKSASSLTVPMLTTTRSSSWDMESANGTPDRCEEIIHVIRTTIEALPAEALSHAAISIKAYARAIRYTEMNARQRDTATVISGGVPNALPPVRKDNHLHGDHIPLLSHQDVAALSLSYAMLEDVDSLQGLQVIRKAQRLPDPSNRFTILAAELCNDWMNALLEYDLRCSSREFQASRIRWITQCNAGSTRKRRRVCSGATPNTAFMQDESYSSADEFGEGLMSREDLCEVERGRLRCMLELSQFEAVVNHVIIRKESDAALMDLQRAVLPLGVEASWRLSDWDSLDSLIATVEKNGLFSTSSSTHRLKRTSEPLLTGEGDDSFRVNIGRLLSFHRKGDTYSFAQTLRSVRLELVNSLSAASMESYNRAYPYLVRLHCLSDLQKSLEMRLDERNLGSSQQSDGLPLFFSQRLANMADSITHRSQVLAVHRAVFSLLPVTSPSSATVASCLRWKGESWLKLGTYLNELGRYSAAYTVLKHAQQCGVDGEMIELRQCFLLREEGRIQEALALLEPAPLDIDAIATHLRDLQTDEGRHRRRKGTGVPGYLENSDKRRILAERVYFATKCLQESQLCQGAAIVERYNVVLALHESWDTPYCDLAKYYEYLYQQYIHRATGSAASNSSGGGASTSSQLTGTVSLGSSLSSVPEGIGAGEFALIEKALEKYGQCLAVTTSPMVVAEVLPRMLTLWLAFTAIAPPNPPKSSKKDAAPVSESALALQQAQASANAVINALAKSIPAHIWYTSVAQLVSRILHTNEGTVAVILSILSQIMLQNPKHAVWHIANLMYSVNAERKALTKKLFRDIYKHLSVSSKADAQMLVDSQFVIQSLISLAGMNTKEKRMRWVMDKKVALTNFIVPVQHVLLSCSSVQPMMMEGFDEYVDVASSKAKPKTLVVITQCGKRIKFLCKQEKDGDLRKDAHMMEVNTLVNRLLASNIGGRQRGLCVTTYGVICLNEECGLLEWVNNTECLRQVVNAAYAQDPIRFPNISFKDVYQSFVDFQTKNDGNLPELVSAYTALIASFNYRPCFHKWFLLKYTDPTAWLMARERFTHSVAVWSAIGYVIGLGDRHTENILINTQTSEAVHVDFDCLFDKGLSLTRPEIVPFRLTSNMIDAMGIMGVEGPFRRTLELCLSVLRDHREALLSVLEPFLRDPTVCWHRSGRAQRGVDAQANNNAQGKAHGGDLENKEANDMLMKISDRLRGVYNIVHPHRDKLVRTLSSATGGGRSNTATSGRGLGATKEEQMLPLSVAGQAQRLIDESTAVENLCQLYVGWQPWM